MLLARRISQLLGLAEILDVISLGKGCCDAFSQAWGPERPLLEIRGLR